MLDGSQSRDDRRLRPLRSEEKDLIEKALGISLNVDLNNVKVLDADDGCMGSVRFHKDQSSIRFFGSELARLRYVDADSIPVSITINLDQNGDLFEIDFWKSNFSPLVVYPNKYQLEEEKC